MPHRLDRRQMLALFATAGGTALLPAAAFAVTDYKAAIKAAVPASDSKPAPVLGDILLGKADAPVTVIEYASFTCPHCARFAMNDFPQFKTEYVDTGKANFIMREVYFDRFGLWASMVARCGGPGGFYPMAEQFLTKQKVWITQKAEDIPVEIRKIGRLNGLSADAVNACLTDQSYAKKLIEQYQKNASADGVNATPTFFINGEKAEGEMSFDAFSKLIDKHLPKS